MREAVYDIIDIGPVFRGGPVELSPWATHHKEPSGSQRTPCDKGSFDYQMNYLQLLIFFFSTQLPCYFFFRTSSHSPLAWTKSYLQLLNFFSEYSPLISFLKHITQHPARRTKKIFTIIKFHLQHTASSPLNKKIIYTVTGIFPSAPPPRSTKFLHNILILVPALPTQQNFCRHFDLVPGATHHNGPWTSDILNTACMT